MSLESLAALLLLAVALLLGVLWRSRRMQQSLLQLEQSLQRAEAAGQEQAARIAALEALHDTQQLAEHAVATGTAVVREVHKGIADIPFSVLESIPGTRAPAKVLRELHDSISEGVYGALSNLNKAVGRELRKGVPLAEKPAAKADAASSASPLPASGTAPQAQENTEPDPPKSWG